MALVQVTGQITGIPDGEYGRADFRTTSWLVDPAADVIAAPFWATVGTGDDGEFVTALPDNRTYSVTLYAGGLVQQGTLVIPAGAAAFDLADRLDIGGTVEPGVTYVRLATVGQANGVAALDSGGKVPATQLPAASGGAPAWSEITEKPTVFPPDTHTHTISAVTGLQAALDACATDTDVAALDTRVDALEAAPGGGGGTAATFGRTRVAAASDITMANSGGVFVPVAGLTVAVAAAAGDNVEASIAAMANQASTEFFELVILVGGAIVRYSSTGTSSPSAEGDPSMYPMSGVLIKPLLTRWGLTLAGGDVSGGTVTFGLAYKGPGGGAGKVYASVAYPFRMSVRNDH